MIASAMLVNVLTRPLTTTVQPLPTKATADTERTLPAPKYVIERVAAMYDGGPFTRLDFRQNASAEAVIVKELTRGFSVFEDSPTKPGLIATEVGSRVTLRLPTDHLEVGTPRICVFYIARVSHTIVLAVMSCHAIPCTA
jgi:hypothetical protein